MIEKLIIIAVVSAAISGIAVSIWSFVTARNTPIKLIERHPLWRDIQTGEEIQVGDRFPSDDCKGYEYVTNGMISSRLPNVVTEHHKPHQRQVN